MLKSLKVLAAGTLMALALSTFHPATAAEAKKTAPQVTPSSHTAQKYVCPKCKMEFDKPGKCPMCKVTLVAKATSAAPTRPAASTRATKPAARPAATKPAARPAAKPATRATTRRPATRATTRRPATRATTRRPATRATTRRPVRTTAIRHHRMTRPPVRHSQNTRKAAEKSTPSKTATAEKDKK